MAPSILPNCKECGKHWVVGGPIWSNPIHDLEWVSLIHTDVTESKNRFPAFDKVHGLLTAVLEVLPALITEINVCLEQSHHKFCAGIARCTSLCQPPWAEWCFEMCLPFKWAILQCSWKCWLSLIGLPCKPFGFEDGCSNGCYLGYIAVLGRQPHSFSCLLQKVLDCCWCNGSLISSNAVLWVIHRSNYTPSRLNQMGLLGASF